MWHIGIGALGYGCIIFIRESIKLTFLLYYLTKHGPKEATLFKLDSFIDIKSRLGQHIIQFIKTWFNVYIPYLGWEINTFLLGQLHNNDFNAAWSSLQSLCGLGYTLGGGCGQRT